MEREVRGVREWWGAEKYFNDVQITSTVLSMFYNLTPLLAPSNKHKIGCFRFLVCYDYCYCYYYYYFGVLGKLFKGFDEDFFSSPFFMCL